jgi:hypothetical protein
MVARQDAARRIEASFGFSVRIERSGLIEEAVFVMLSSPAWLPIDEVGSVVLRQAIEARWPSSTRGPILSR